jgi:hypothetical protein
MLLWTLWFACHPSVQVAWLKPSDVTLPPDFTRVALIDREQGDRSMVVSGAVERELYDSTRLELAPIGATDAAWLRAPDPAGRDVSPATADRVCRETGANGLGVIESTNLTFQDELTSKEREVERDGKTVTIKVWTITRTFEAQASFSLLRCDASEIDHITLRESDTDVAEGRSPAEARGKLADDDAIAAALMEALGMEWASHVVPTWTDDRRPYFRNGHPELVAGHEAIQTDKLRAAEKAWTSVWDGANSDRERGRAAFNLAVLAELSGDVKVALQWAKEAKKRLGDAGIVHAYLAILRQRKVLDGLLQQQLEMSP